jgi:ADP-heptose:LPS heptosyltransferase
MLPFKVPTDRDIPAAIPENIDLVKWAGIIKACDYFLGCDSVGQHFAHALDKPTTVVIGSTFPENISYPDNKNFTVIDNGKATRTYTPIRLTHDIDAERTNEDSMILSADTYTKIIKSVENKLGVSKAKKDFTTNVKPINTQTQSMPNFAKKATSLIEDVIVKEA